MAILDLVLWAGVVIFMVGSLASVGLGLAPRAAVAPLTHGRFVVHSLVASWVVCPVVAYVLLRVIPLAPLAAIDPDLRTVVMIAIGAPVTVAISALTVRWLAQRREPQLA